MKKWFEWYHQIHEDFGQIEKAWGMSCKEHNIGRKKRSRFQLQYIAREDVRPEPTVLDTDANHEVDKFFDFQRLIRDHPDIARRIAKYTMHKGVVNFVCRLDTTERYPPLEGGLDRMSRLPKRFHWNGKKCNINSAPRLWPTLAPMFVHRDFMEIFGTAFFALNTFSFQSFGELAAFTRSIRRAWIQRMTKIQLWWLGSVNQRPPNWQKGDDKFDRRTFPLHTLTYMSRLKHLEIFLDETSNIAMRRRSEPDWVIRPMKLATSGMQNNRLFRDLRKLQGTDWVYFLRGLVSVEVYDIDQDTWKKKACDQTFVDDLRTQVCGPKPKRVFEASRIENLKPMLRRNQNPAYIPVPQIDYIVRSFFGKRYYWDSKTGTMKKLERPVPKNGNHEGDNRRGYDDDDAGPGDDEEAPRPRDDAPNNGGNNKPPSDSDLEDDDVPPNGGVRLHANHGSAQSQVRVPNVAVAQFPGFRGRYPKGCDPNSRSRVAPSANTRFVDLPDSDSSDSDSDDCGVEDRDEDPKTIDLTTTPDEHIVRSIEDESPPFKDEDVDENPGADKTPSAGDPARSPSYSDSKAPVTAEETTAVTDMAVPAPKSPPTDTAQDVAPKIEDDDQVIFAGSICHRRRRRLPSLFTRSESARANSIDLTRSPRAAQALDSTGPVTPHFASIGLTGDDETEDSLFVLQDPKVEADIIAASPDRSMPPPAEPVSMTSVFAPVPDIEADIFNQLDFGSASATPTPGPSSAAPAGPAADLCDVPDPSPKRKSPMFEASPASDAQLFGLSLTPSLANVGDRNERPAKRPRAVSDLQIAVADWHKVVSKEPEA